MTSASVEGEVRDLPPLLRSLIKSRITLRDVRRDLASSLSILLASLDISFDRRISCTDVTGPRSMAAARAVGTGVVEISGAIMLIRWCDSLATYDVRLESSSTIGSDGCGGSWPKYSESRASRSGVAVLGDTGSNIDSLLANESDLDRMRASGGGCCGMPSPCALYPPSPMLAPVAFARWW